MRREPLLLLGLGLLVAGVATAAWLLLRTPATRDVPILDGAAPTEQDPTAELAEATPAAEPTVEAVVSPSLSEPEAVRVDPSALPESYTGALAGVTGRLLEADGSPAAGLPVELLELYGDPYFESLGTFFDGVSELPDVSVSRATTDDGGRFNLDGSHARAFHALGIDLGGPRGALRILDQALVPGERTDLGDIVLSPFVTFVGRVVDEQRQPVAGARVRATTLPAIIFQVGVQDFRNDSTILVTEGGRSGVFEIPPEVAHYVDKLPVPTTSTDDEGGFRLEGVPQGLVTLVVDKAGHLGATLPRPSGRGGERNVGDVLLSSGRSIRGQVVDSVGEPVRGAEVVAGTVMPFAPLAIAQPCGLTDAEGAFELGGLAQSGAVLVAARLGGLNWKISGPFDDDSQIVVTLPVEHALTVRLVDTAEQVVPEAHLLARGDSLLGEVPLLVFAPFRALPRNLTKVEDGLYRTELPAGRYQLLGRAEGFGIATASVDLTEGPAEALLQFPPGFALTVQVLDLESREPVEHARVGVLSTGFGPALAKAWTDAGGVAHLESLPGTAGGELQIRASHPGYATASTEVQPDQISADSEPLLLALDHGGAIEGVLHVAGRAPPDLYMVMVFSRGNFRHPDDEMPLLTVSDFGGQFAFTHLVPGEYRYEVYERFLAEDPHQMDWETFDPDDVARGRVHVEAGETTTLEIDLATGGSTGPGGEIRGRVRIGGQPAEGLNIHVYAEKSFQAETDASGSYSLSVPGDCWLQISDNRQQDRPSYSALHAEQLQLAPNEVKVIDLDLPAPIEVIVEVSSPHGDALAESQVQLHEQNENSVNSSAFGMTDSAGQIQLSVVRPGRYMLTAEHAEFGTWAETVEIPASGSTPRFRVQLDPGVPCAGRIEIPGEVATGTERNRFLLLQLMDTEGRGSRNRQVMLEPGSDRFEVFGLQPGRYRVHYFDGGRGIRQTEFDLGPAGDRHLLLRFGEG